MLSNKNYDNQSNLLIDSITSNTQASFNNSTFTGLLTLPSGQIVTASKELVDLNSPQTLTNKTLTQYSNVENTSDLDKPISTDTQTALDLKANLASPTFTGTITLPNTSQTLTSTTTLVDLNSVQTLTNKTLSTGSTWTGSAVGLAYGGTGSSLSASNGAVTYSTASGLALSAVGTSGQVLTSAGAGAPTWTTPTVYASTGKSIAMAMVFGG
jgi:hypothetical protein